MLHDIYYIITPRIIQQPVKAVPDATIALRLNAGDINTHLFQIAEQYLINQPFCLLLQLQEQLSIDQANNIIAFFFFSNYHKPGGTPQIILEGENEPVLQAGIELLQQSAKAQAFPVVQFTLATTIQNRYTSDEKPAITAIYKGWLQSPNISSDILYVNVSQLPALENINQALEAEETLLEQQNAGLFMLKKQNRQLRKQVQQLELFCQAAQQEISNQVSHNQILRSQSQATALQNYYNSEYEVLPLWYKRLGHIIKVFIGKRSFKSLFSDKVKKYRD
ncbi:hypothetical protein A3860_18745 [Niastella vici]|uniref:Uncharacterized protein n=1 Tax=Niastella vici TaxID=1703345 RepID=A0A1V9G2V5_9BACT|nr:hypothetical protein [Niastella vici]OQP64796.1 hypothetical protein A3860_18745 [Niastella vici]